MTLISTRSEVTEVGRVRVDPARAYELLDSLMDAYLRRQGLYQHVHRVDAPQTTQRPGDIKVGSVEHARWLFFAAMTDRRDLSSLVYARHRKMWEEYADILYNKSLDLFTTREIVLELLKDHEFSMPDTSADSWVACSGTLFDKLGGDPTVIYQGNSIDDVVRLKKRTWDLPGFGSKILSLLAIFYAENDMIETPPDAFPVDVHVQRFALSTGILTLKQPERNTTLEGILRPLLSEVCRIRGWTAVDLSHAIWFLGNKLCTACSKSVQSELYCPVLQDCDGPFSTKDYFKKGLWDPASRRPKGWQREPGWLPKDLDGALPFTD